MTDFMTKLRPRSSMCIELLALYIRGNYLLLSLLVDHLDWTGRLPTFRHMISRA